MRLLIIWTFSLGVYSSANGTALTVNQVQEDVLKTLPLLKQMKQEILQKQAQIQITQGSFDTKIHLNSENTLTNEHNKNSIEMGLQRNTSLLGIALFAGQRMGKDPYLVYGDDPSGMGSRETYIGATLPLLRNLLIDNARYARESARLDLNSEQENFKLNSLELLNVASKRYWDWVLTFHILKVRRDILKLAEDRHRIYEQRSRFGDLEKIKLTDNLRLINKRKSENNESQQSFIKASLDLQLYLEEGSVVDEKKAPSSWNFESTKPHESQLDWTQVKQKWPAFNKIDIEKQKINLDSDFYDHQRLPLLNFKIEGVQSMSSGSDLNRTPNHLNVGLLFDYPLENNKIKGDFKRVQAKKIALNAQYEWLNKQFDTQVHQLSSLLKQSKELIDMRQNEVNNTVKMRLAEQLRVEKGSSDLYILNLREEDEAQAKVNLHMAFHRYHQLLMDYEMLAGLWFEKLEPYSNGGVPSQ